MKTQTTNGIKISVETFYHNGYSVPTENKVFFAYRITIHNLNDFSVQLLRRYWKITDSDGRIREVEGEGVIGEQPVLQVEQSHTYVSGCPLRTGIGKMEGHFTMENLEDGNLFEVEVPVFRMVADFKAN